jgi:hypothetical protein
MRARLSRIHRRSGFARHSRHRNWYAFTPLITFLTSRTTARRIYREEVLSRSPKKLASFLTAAVALAPVHCSEEQRAPVLTRLLRTRGH